MTVKELKDRLDNFPENYIVYIPNSIDFGYAQALNVSSGVNELDTCVYIDDCED